MNRELVRWCTLTKKENEIYRNLSKKLGLSEAEFWVMYALTINEDGVCQSKLCSCFSYPKQTICTAVASLEKDSLVELGYIEGSKKLKNIYLTKKGKEFSIENIKPIIDKEEEVLNRFDIEKRKMFFDFYDELLNKIDEVLNEE